MRQGDRVGRAAHYRLAAVLALLLLAAGLGWRAWQPARADGAVAAAPAAAGGGAVAPEATASAPARQAVASGAGAASAPPAGPARPAAAPLAAAEVCGVGQVPLLPGADPRLPADVAVLPPHLDRYPVDAARERVLATLEAGSLRQRVLALLWRDLQAVAPGPDPVAAQGLVNEAAAGSDLVAISGALRLCDALPDAPACQRALLAAALRTDPANARWHVQRLLHPAEAEAAWAGLLQAQFWRAGFGEQTAVARAAMPADLPAYVAATLAGEVLGGVDSALLDHHGPVLRRCGRSARPAERAPQADCDRLARLMAERSDTLLTLSIARSVAEGAGWPDQIRAQLEAEHQSLLALSSVPPAAEPMGCAALEAQGRWLDALARDGEVAALRARRQR